MKKTILIITTVIAVILSACGTAAAPAATSTGTARPAAPDAVRVMTLNGTTGFSMAQLIDRAQGGETELNYVCSVETDASVVMASLINGDADIAALPTNAAATLFNKSGGEIQLIALNTRGVLYLLSTDDSITDFESLRGKTVYIPAQNPTFIFAYLCRQNGLEPGTDIIIDNSYAQPAELNAALSAGQVQLAVLPEPMVTVALAANTKLSVRMDLSTEWDAVGAGSLIQGCAVVRRSFAESYPQAVTQFLADYGASVELLTQEPDSAAALIEATGVFPKAQIALKALPNCNICFITGDDMRGELEPFLEVMLAESAQSIGGTVPNESFYYCP